MSMDENNPDMSISRDDIHIDWHQAAERVLKGKVRSLVTFTEFREWMNADGRINYIDDAMMVGLYYLHVQVDHLQVLEAMGPERVIDFGPDGHPNIMTDTSGSMPHDEDYVPPTKADMIRELAERNDLGYFQVEVTDNTKPEDLFGVYRPMDGTMQFLSAAERVERETKPPLTRRAKRAMRRARKKLRGSRG